MLVRISLFINLDLVESIQHIIGFFVNGAKRRRYWE